jgi:hypothetical protein
MITSPDPLTMIGLARLTVGISRRPTLTGMLICSERLMTVYDC